MKLVNLYSEVFKGRPFMQDTPNEFAYLDFKKWAYPRRGKIKQRLQTVLDNNQANPGTAFFKELTRIWVTWANQNNEEFSVVNPTDVGQKDFGRALAVMMKKDDLIIQKDTNKLLDLKERPLTPKEKKDKEKIVKGLKGRKDLDKSAKYAIATAQSKKMEENKSFDEKAKLYFLDLFQKGKIDKLPDDPKVEFIKQYLDSTDSYKKIQQSIDKEKNEEKISGFDYHYTKGTSGGTQQFGRPRMVNESLKKTLKRRAGIIK